MNLNTELAGEQAAVFFCNIGFEVKVFAHIDKISDGQCWYPLFRSPVIARGYPIRQRPMPYKGLEIWLGTLGNLVGASSISPFDNKFFIKGFATMLVAMEYFDDVVL